MRKQAPSGHTNLPTHFIKSYTKMIYCLPMFHVLLIDIYILHYVTLTVKFNERAWPDKCRRIIGTLDGFCSLGFCSAALTAYRNPNITLARYRPLSRCLVLCVRGLPTSRVQRRFRDKRLFSKEDNIKVQFREKVLDKVRPVESVQEWWEETSSTILRVGHDVLGMTTGR